MPLRLLRIKGQDAPSTSRQPTSGRRLRRSALDVPYQAVNRPCPYRGPRTCSCPGDNTSVLTCCFLYQTRSNGPAIGAELQGPWLHVFEPRDPALISSCLTLNIGRYTAQVWKIYLLRLWLPPQLGHQRQNAALQGKTPGGLRSEINQSHCVWGITTPMYPRPSWLDGLD